jgi:hypothetical protein
MASSALTTVRSSCSATARTRSLLLLFNLLPAADAEPAVRRACGRMRDHRASRAAIGIPACNRTPGG